MNELMNKWINELGEYYTVYDYRFHTTFSNSLYCFDTSCSINNGLISIVLVCFSEVRNSMWVFSFDLAHFKDTYMIECPTLADSANQRWNEINFMWVLYFHRNCISLVGPKLTHFTLFRKTKRELAKPLCSEVALKEKVQLTAMKLLENYSLLIS